MAEAATQSFDIPNKLRIISLNCWGLKYISTLRNERLTEIGNQLAAAKPAPDIVGLQECWTQQDYNVIREKTRHFLPHGKFYFSGCFGGGLAILSRWPIQESSMIRYPLNGRPSAFFRGDWFVGKGVACARIRMGPRKRDIAEVFCTHLHAPYEREPNDSYICHRTAQAWEIAKLMRHASERGHLVVGLGDFNMIPLSLAHQLIETHAPVRDIWRLLYPDSSIGAYRDKVEKARGLPMPNASHNISHNGTTCDSALNSWRWSPELKKRVLKNRENIHIEDTVNDPRAKRLDYIFVSSGPHAPTSSSDAKAMPNEWSIESANVGMTMRHPTLHVSLSDHFSIETTLVRTQGTQSAPDTDPNLAFLPIQTYNRILDITRKYIAREHKQRRLRIANFFTWFTVMVGCWVAVWWAPRNFVAFILMFVSTLGIAGGVVDGLMGFLFVGTEERALWEFEWEIEEAKRQAEAAASRLQSSLRDGGSSSSTLRRTIEAEGKSTPLS